jgi:hypothetical protein
VNCLGDAFDSRRLSGIDRTPELESKSLDVALQIGGFGIISARDELPPPRRQSRQQGQGRIAGRNRSTLNPLICLKLMAFFQSRDAPIFEV